MDPTLFPDIWLKYAPGVDLPTMFGIGVIAFALQRSHHVPDWVTLLVPLGLGMIVGIAQAIQAGYAPAFIVMKGAFVNGGAAYIMALAVNMALSKWAPQPDAPLPPTPPKA